MGSISSRVKHLAEKGDSTSLKMWLDDELDELKKAGYNDKHYYDEFLDVLGVIHMSKDLALLDRASSYLTRSKTVNTPPLTVDALTTAYKSWDAKQRSRGRNTLPLAELIPLIELIILKFTIKSSQY